MNRLLLVAAALLLASPALAQQSRLLQQQPQNRFQAQPGSGLAARQQQQLQLAPNRGGRLITDNGAGLIGNAGGTFRR